VVAAGQSHVVANAHFVVPSPPGHADKAQTFDCFQDGMFVTISAQVVAVSQVLRLSVPAYRHLTPG
jgi:hypothetical protein